VDGSVRPLDVPKELYGDPDFVHHTEEQDDVTWKVVQSLRPVIKVVFASCMVGESGAYFQDVVKLLGVQRVAYKCVFVMVVGTDVHMKIVKSLQYPHPYGAFRMVVGDGVFL